MSATELGPLWCHDFDARIEAVVPDALSMLGEYAHVKLRTHATPTNGRINCPSAWWTDHGLTSFFATPQWGAPAPVGYWTDKPLINCTFEEVVRDEWIHGQTVVVNGRFVWKPPEKLMMDLMFDLRGWTVLDAPSRDATQESVRLSLAAAVSRLATIVPAASASATGEGEA